MDFIYNDYASWKLEKDELIRTLFSKKSFIVMRFKHVFDVVEYIYDKKVEKSDTITSDEEIIFASGFNYLYIQFDYIQNLINKYFNSIDDMKCVEKAINLLLYISDFEKDIENKEILEKLEDIESETFEHIKEHKDIPDEFFVLLDDLLLEAFPNENYTGIIEIFYDIAEELGIEVE